MTNFYQSKVRHELHLARDPEGFIDLFTNKVGKGPVDVISEHVPLELIESIFLVGSIPHQTSTSVSDVDFVILTSTDDFNPGLASTEVLKFNRGRGDVALAGITSMEKGVEFDLTICSVRTVDAIYERLKGGNTRLNAQELRLLSRIQTGWCLHASATRQSSGYQQPDADLLAIYASTQHYIDALKALEDARAALKDNFRLSHFLGRVGVEKAFFALFASRGHAALGTKWLRFSHRFQDPDSNLFDSSISELCKVGIPLLFKPDFYQIEIADSYLGSVTNFIIDTRKVVEQRRKFKVAFSLCPQIYPLAT